MKTCSKCGERRVSEFYVSKTGQLSGYCKACTVAIERAWYLTHKERKAETNRRWRQRHRERRKRAVDASNAVWRAVQAGVLVRATTCEDCAKSGKIEAAHVDYTQPLAVKWLCRSCHRLWDAREPKTLAPVVCP